MVVYCRNGTMPGSGLVLGLTVSCFNRPVFTFMNTSAI